MEGQGKFYTADKYRSTVGKATYSWLKDYENVELSALSFVNDPKSKTFIDLGAGYGRIMPTLAPIARNVVAIELNKSMFLGLSKEVKKYKNVIAIQGDMYKIKELLKKNRIKVSRPVILLMQNTLGRIEDVKGSIDTTDRGVLRKMMQVARENDGEVIVSIFKQTALKEIGIPLYTSIKAMVGEPDIRKCNFGKGIFVSKTGYVSKWWTPTERSKILKLFGGQLLHDVETPLYSVLHIKP